MTPPPPPGDEEAFFAFRRDVVLAASAGTGKTHALVGVIVHLVMGASSLGTAGLRSAIDPGRIVATTFSRRAALEIRTRLEHELDVLASPDGHGASPYRDVIAARVASSGLSPWVGSQLNQRARRALEGLHRAEIGTLHGVAAAILSRHALEVGLPTTFDVASDDEERRRRENAVERALETAFTLTEPAVRLLVESAGSVDLLVERLADTLGTLAEDGRPPGSFLVDTGDEARIATRIASFVRAAARCDTPRFTTRARTLAKAWEDADDDDLEHALVDLFSIENRGKRTPEEAAFFELRDALPPKPNVLRARALARTHRARAAFGEVARTARGILADAALHLDRATKEAGALGFSEILVMARDLLRDRVDVAREVASRYDVLLVDEAQDTSRVQRDMVQLLWARDAVRAAGRIPRITDARPAGLFVVGDRKQSIYGFRGADVGVFAEMCVGLAGEAAARALRIPPELAEVPRAPLADFFALRHNRRGLPPLLRFANAFSARHFQPAVEPAALYEIDYADETEDLLSPPASGQPAPDEAAGPRVTWLRVEGTQKGPARVDEARIIAARVATEVSSGSPLSRTGVRPTYRDIAVLAQTNEMLDTVSFALAEARIPYVAVGRGFFTAREVHDLVRMLALLVDPGDRVALLTVLRGAWVGLHDESLVGLTGPEAGLLPPDRWDEGPRRALVRPEDEEPVRRIRDFVRETSRIVDRLGPRRALELAVEELGFTDTLRLLPRGVQRVANVDKLLELAAGEPNARVFLRWAERRIADDALVAEAQTASGEDDAVQLLTVHGSKGLDFPVVFIPEIASSPRAAPRPPVLFTPGDASDGARLAVRLYDASQEVYLEPPSYEAACEERKRRDRAEKQRLFYVAVTRARDRIFLVGPADTRRDDHAAGTLAALAATEEGRACLEVSPVAPAPPTGEPGHDGPLITVLDLPAHGPPERDPPAIASFDIAPTALADFEHCPRRFALVHLHAFPEHTHGARWSMGPRSEGPTGAGDGALPLDARREGTLVHAVLERLPERLFGAEDPRAEVSQLLAAEGLPADQPAHETHTRRVSRFLSGPYARRIRDLGARVLREHAFLLEVPLPPLPSERTPKVTLRGAIDLVVLWPDGAIDVVDYKRARGPRIEPYAFQLDVYALAVRALREGDLVVRTGILFLGAESPEPRFREPTAPDELRARVAELVMSLRRARHTDVFPRAPLTTCHALHCGYVGRCHPGGAGGGFEGE